MSVKTSEFARLLFVTGVYFSIIFENVGWTKAAYGSVVICFFLTLEKASS